MIKMKTVCGGEMAKKPDDARPCKKVHGLGDDGFSRNSTQQRGTSYDDENAASRHHASTVVHSALDKENKGQKDAKIMFGEGKKDTIATMQGEGKKDVIMVMKANDNEQHAGSRRISLVNLMNAIQPGSGSLKDLLVSGKAHLSERFLLVAIQKATEVGSQDIVVTELKAALKDLGHAKEEAARKMR